MSLHSERDQVIHAALTRAASEFADQTEMFWDAQAEYADEYLESAIFAYVKAYVVAKGGNAYQEFKGDGGTLVMRYE